MIRLMAHSGQWTGRVVLSPRSRRLEIQASMENTNSSEVSPSGKNFLARFVQEQRARGRSSGPLDGLFAHLADVTRTDSLSTRRHDGPPHCLLRYRSVPPPRAIRDRQKSHAAPLFEHLGTLVSTRAPAESWPLGHREPPPPAPAPQVHAARSDGPMKTVHDFTAERAARRAQLAEPPAPLVLFRPVESLTACMDSAECPATARHIFRVLFSLGLESVRARGVPVRPDVAVFHLPLELLAAHIERDRTTVWRNLRPLIASGVLAAVDHYGTLRGQTAVTGKVWAGRCARSGCCPATPRRSRSPWRTCVIPGGIWTGTPGRAAPCMP